MKRAQMTIFVIIGLVVVLMISIFLFLDTEIQLDDVRSPDVYTQTYDADIQNIVNDVTFCLQQTSTEAFEILGRSGGFIYQDQNLVYNSFVEYQNTALKPFRLSDLKIPYWYNLVDNPACADCRFRTHYLPLEGQNSIASQVERYVQENIVSCLDDFSRFSDTYEITHTQPVAEVFFNELDTMIGLDMQVNATNLATRDTISAEKYLTTLDLEFKNIYELAIEILESTIIRDQALNDFAIEMINLRELQDDSIPPMFGGEREGIAGNIWLRSEVRDHLRDFFSENINMIQIFDSKESQMYFGFDPFLDTIYNKFQYAIDDLPIKQNTRITFNYNPTWPLYLNINPGGEVIAPRRNTFSLMFIRVNTLDYNFFYNLAYPVLVTLEHDESFENNGYTFQFAVEGNVRANSDYSLQVSPEALDKIITHEDLENQRTVPTKIKVLDGYTGLPKQEIDVLYVCLESEIYAGRSDSQGNIETYLPPCVNGFFEPADQINYTSDIIYHTSDIDESNEEVILRVYEPVELSLDIRAMPLQKREVQDAVLNDEYEWVPVSEGFVSPKPNQEALVIFTRLDNFLNPTDFTRLVTVNSTENGFEPATVELVPGIYNFMFMSSLNLSYDFDGYIKTQNETVTVRDCVLWEIWCTGEDIVINSTRINDTMVTGFVSFNVDENTEFIIEPEDLIGKSSIRIKYPTINLNEIVTTRDLRMISDMMEAHVNRPEIYKLEIQ